MQSMGSHEIEVAAPLRPRRRPAALAVVYEWGKWFLFGLVVAAVCVAACWVDGARAGVHIIRSVKEFFQENREQQQERQAKQATQELSNGHASRSNSTTYNALPTSIKSVSSALVAASGELETKNALERLLSVPFCKLRPAWLRNTVHNTGRNLEIDCYNEALGIAVEFSGPQHYVYPVFIVVPYTVQRKSIQAFLRTELIERGVALASK
jgi:hypothetical protein